MAEPVTAAGVALAAEQVASTAVEGATAAYIISKPTLPLKATYTRIATAADDHTRRSLARSNHTLTVIDNKAYIFGGNTACGDVASNDLHVVTLEHSGSPEMDYALIPALPTFDDKEVPTPRTMHAACSFHGNVVIYGGYNEKDELIVENSSLWMYNPERKTWDKLESKSESVPGPRRHAKLFGHEESIILYGGGDEADSCASDIWKFDVATKTWVQLPTAPVSTSNAALANGELWLISGIDPVTSQLHHLDISSQNKDMSWATFKFPTNPLSPGPRARHDGALVPITTGYGRNYLAYFFGEKDFAGRSTADSSPNASKKADNVIQWSDMWTLQLPSSHLEVKLAMKFKEAIKPAKIKDAIRSALGADSGKLSWAETEVQVPSDLQDEYGKLHPGPRAFFGADAMEGEGKLVFWGGENAKGERVVDGWIVKLE